jgi:pimeloyl-ACP methyl ester carboxylesterase
VLNHVRRGSGEPLVLIHPLGGELVVWEPVLDLLARERDAIAVDLPGFGRSARRSNGARPTPQLPAGSVGCFMDQLGIERGCLKQHLGDLLGIVPRVRPSPPEGRV